jgi:hypothetical protein
MSPILRGSVSMIGLERRMPMLPRTTRTWIAALIVTAMAGCEGGRAGLTAPSAAGSASFSQIGGIIPFPPRNEPFDFRTQLEQKYRTGLGRSAGPSFVDLEGEIVWTQEYLRYRVNGCGHADAQQKVFDQIDGRGIAPACADLSPGTIAFPPRNEPFDFRTQLEQKYRVGLGRSAVQTFVDLEGAIVWTQEYLRYRINSCGHAVAVTKVFDQIDGRGIAPICRDSAELSGVWSGSSTYVNAPFTMDLRQTGATVTGQYRDQRDSGSVSGTLSGSAVALNVNFGDTGIQFTGSLVAPNRVTGEIFVAVLGGRRFPFEMVR